MKVYIDTNIYISLLSSTSDIKSWKKLKSLMDKNEVEVLLPTQTKLEIERHLEGGIKTINQKISNLKSHSYRINPPPSIVNKNKKDLSKIEIEVLNKIKDIETEALNKIKDIDKEYQKEIEKQIKKTEEHKKEVEEILKYIFKKSILINVDESIITKALVRYTNGLPPRKQEDDGKYGDSIIWETLKSYVRSDDLNIISHDADFAQKKSSKIKVKKEEINLILKKEWKQHTGKNLTLYKLLSYFINEIDESKPIHKETIDNEIFEIRKTEILDNTLLFQNRGFMPSYVNQGILPNHTNQSIFSGGIIDTTAYSSNNLITPNIHTKVSDITGLLNTDIFRGVSPNGLILPDNNMSILNYGTNGGIQNIDKVCHMCGKPFKTNTSLYYPTLELCDKCSTGQYFRP